MSGLSDLVRKGAVYSIAALILFIVILIVAGLFVTIYHFLQANPFDLGRNEILDFFGELLLVVIALELLDIIWGLLDESRIKAETVLLVSVTAVSRELIVFNYESSDGMKLIGLGVLIAAAATGYFLIMKAMPRGGAPDGPS